MDAGDDLRRSHARYRSLVEATAMDVWRADSAGDLVGDMPEWRARTGQSPVDVLGTGWLDAIHPDHRDRVASLWETAVKTGEPYEAEYPIRDEAGGWRTVVARGTPVRDDDGNVREWVGTSDDITELRSAEARLREETRTVDTLRSIGSALTASLDLTSLVQTLTEATTALTGARFGTFRYDEVDASGEPRVLHAVSGKVPEGFERLATPPGVVRLDDGEPPVRSYLAVPVVSRNGEVHGALMFGHEDAGVFTERHERLVAGVAAQAAVAIDNARLYEAERAARTDAEAAQQKLQFLATAGELLGSTLDLDQAVTRLATIAVPTLADWSAVHVLDDNGHLQLAAVFHRNGAEQRRLREAFPPDAALDVVESGRPVPVDDPRGVCVPLRARGRVIGALTLGRVAPPDPAEMRLVEELASRAALAIDNAALYSRERRAALTLQRSLLPRAVPALASGACAVRYLPGAAGAEVGGDWYDVVPVSGDRVVVVVGDVMGRGVPAAAVMGQLRSAVRAYALDDHEPAEVLHRVDRMVTTLDDPALTTCLVVRYDAATGEALIATAGHLPPLLVAPDGTASYVESDPGMPLGVGGAEFVQTSVRLAPGTRLVLYTDGLVEDPASSVDEGLSRLCEAATRAVASRLDAESFADALLGAMRPGFEHDDDIALLVFAVHDHAPAASAEELEPTDREAWVALESRPEAVREARRTVAAAVDVWSLPEVADVAVLLTSELATNAVRHAAGDVRLRVVRRPGGLRVEVHDRDATTLPQLQMRNPDGSDDLLESGRGLQFVAELSTRWGVETLAGGKQVWFELDTGT